MVVLDTSAVLAVLLEEPGQEPVIPLLPVSCVSTVNRAGLVGVAVRKGRDLDSVTLAISGLGLRFVPLWENRAFAAGAMLAPTKRAGLSVGNRACLALARDVGLPASTADRSWLGVAADLGVSVELIR